MKVVSLQCPGCAASVSPDGGKCESCGSYYHVLDEATSLITPAVRLFAQDGRFVFVYGPRQSFLLGRHCEQVHVPVRDARDRQRLGVSRKAALVTLSDLGPVIQRVGQSPVTLRGEHGAKRELKDFEMGPLISGMRVSFGLSDHFWMVDVLETASGKVGVLLCEPGGQVRHLLISTNDHPARFLDSDTELTPLGTVRPTFTEGWIPQKMSKAGKPHGFPTACEHVWYN
ncbi:MAG: hypothetical protein HQ488_01895 [Parcubacteria group bacterium]|nr:hypothetical protein [Parcubacteria group bacterium]